jgi:hypothetical protein
MTELFRRPPPLPSSDVEPDYEESSLPFETLPINAAALPAAFLFSLICKWLVVPGFFLNFFCMVNHELGHACCAWLSGYRALPFIAFTSISANPSAVTKICVGFLIATAIFFGVIRRAPVLIFAGVILLALQAKLSFFTSKPEAHFAFFYAGVAGQFVISTVMILFFYYRFPEKWRWDFWRFVSLIIGAYVFLDAVLQWRNISLHWSAMPWGTFFQGQDDGGGDLNQLREIYGWSERTITDSYLKLARWCGVLIAGHYLVFLIRASVKKTPKVAG